MTTQSSERIPALTLGWRLKMALGDMKRDEMAGHLGVDPATISRWMGDKGSRPKLVPRVGCASHHNLTLCVFMETTQNLIGTAEAARILDRSHRTVHRLVESGRLVPALTAPGGFRGSFLFRRDDVERLRDRDVAA